MPVQKHIEQSYQHGNKMGMPINQTFPLYKYYKIIITSPQ